MKQKFKINYEVLQPMDLVLTSTSGIKSVFVRGVTTGGKNMFNKKLATHCGLVINIHDQLLMVEMIGRGINIVSLNDYTNRKKYIVAVRRHYIYIDKYIREIAQKRIALDLRYSLDYDFKGIYSFVNSRVEDDVKRYYCSEYCYMQTAADGIKYPDSFADKVSPYDLQVVSNGFRDIDFKIG